MFRFFVVSFPYRERFSNFENIGVRKNFVWSIERSKCTRKFLWFFSAKNKIPSGARPPVLPSANHLISGACGFPGTTSWWPCTSWIKWWCDFPFAVGNSWLHARYGTGWYTSRTPLPRRNFTFPHYYSGTGTRGPTHSSCCILTKHESIKIVFRKAGSAFGRVSRLSLLVWGRLSTSGNWWFRKGNQLF